MDARDHAAWHAAALELDELDGALEWMEQDDSPHYDAARIRASASRLRSLRERNQPLELGDALSEAIYRHHAQVTQVDLYARGRTGTKRIVDDFLAELERGLWWLTQAPGVPKGEVARRFEAAARIHGRTALLLSGGATWGFQHLGVVKGLFEQGLLPHILSGASTGAMIASGVCTRTDEELAEMYARPETLRLDGLKPTGVRQAVDQRAWLRPEQLHEVLRHNVGDYTFGEAFERSGRVLNISVSPSRARQKPRLLCHVTAPQVRIASAALASSALPGLFPPVELEAQGPDGDVVPYIPGELWVDGSLHGDLPMSRLARLHNVNHFIVSQVNPHVLPFVRHHGQRGVGPALAGLAGSAVRTQGAMIADLARRATREQGPAGQLADRAYGLVSQPYRGDIDLHPQFRWGMYTKLVSNPTPEDLQEFILAGERAVWPRLALLRNQMRLSRTLAACRATLGA